MPTQVKIDQIAELKAWFEKADSIFVTDYAGLNVEQLTKLRRQLRQSGVRYVVAKNTLMRIAARQAGYDDLDQFLSGPTAVAFSNVDPNVPAKILFDASKEFADKGKPQVKSFYVERRHFSATEVERLAKLPGRRELLSQLIAVIESPISGLVGTLDGIIRELVGTIDAVARQKENG